MKCWAAALAVLACCLSTLAGTACGMVVQGGGAWLVAETLPDPVDAAREGLRGRAKYPWYDSGSDDLRRLHPAKSVVTDENRGSKWDEDPSLSPKWNWWWPTLFSGQISSVIGMIFKIFVYLVILALLVGLGYLLVRYYLSGESRLVSVDESPAADAEEDEQTRVENLPFPVQRPVGDFLSEARKHYESGNYAQAIIYLFSHQLMELDKYQWIHLARGKTNRQYLRELRNNPPLYTLLDRTMVMFEDVFFGHYPLGRDRFESCWNAMDDFRSHLSQAAE